MQFEAHAGKEMRRTGKGARRAPYENIRTEDGQSLKSLVWTKAPDRLTATLLNNFSLDICVDACATSI
jgi:hypothetical protein